VPVNGDISFLIGTVPQLDTARRIAAHLPEAARAYDLSAQRTVPLAEMAAPTSHVAPVRPGALRAVASGIGRWAAAGAVLVVPQDVGLLQRRAIAVARRRGALIALAPDGVVSDRTVTQRRRLGGLVLMADGLLRSSGYAAGRLGEMGGSRPDLVLSWGPGWDPVFVARGATSIADVGSPRADGLALLPPPVAGRLLVCSQPTWMPDIGGWEASTIWYGFLARLVAAAPEGAVRVRLHPQERQRLDELNLSAGLRAALTEGTRLEDDLAWSGAVLSWASTTLLEAAGAARPVLAVSPTPMAAAAATGYPFLRDPRIVRRAPTQLDSWDAVETAVSEAAAGQVGLAEDYLAHTGSAAARSAAAIVALADG
jgi:hypothetical protein